MPQRSRVQSWPFIILAIVMVFFLLTNPGRSATPEKPFADLQEGDSLTAAWLMGTFNTLFNWSQVASSTLDTHATNHANHLADTAAHGTTGAVVGTTNTQTLTNKSLDATNSVVGEAINSGTVADERVASTLCRDSELSSHAGSAATHGVSGTIVGTNNVQTLTNKSISGEQINSGTVADARVASTLARDSEVTSAVSTHAGLTGTHGVTTIAGLAETQTLTNKTLGTTNSIDGGAIKTGTVADARIDSAICRDSELTTHANLTAAHGATGAVVGTTNTQTLTNKTLTSPAINDGTTNLDGGVLIAPQTTTPAQTAEGSVVWDTENDLLTIGHGAGRKTLIDADSAQSLTNKSISGEQINSGTVADARVASTLARDSEVSTAVSTHAGLTATHGVTTIAGLAETQTLTNKTLGTTNSIDGGAVKTGTVADARIDSAICRDSELTTHGNLTAAHGATGAVVGTTNTQTLTNKTLTSPTINDGTTNLDGGVLIAPQTTTPAQTTEGSVVWDSDHEVLTVGNGFGGRSILVSETEYQLIKDKALDSSNSIAGEAIKSGTISNSRLDESVITEMELSTAFTQFGTNSIWPVANGGTGATTAANARTNLGVAYGTTAGTVCQGNDSRLSDARTPTTHTHNYAGSDSAGGAANSIRQAAPTTPADGDIWLE